MKTLLALISLASAAHAAPKATLIFQDDFERSESQELKEEIGNGWATNSEKRAAGNKQVDLKDGALHIYISPAADHSVSVTHPAAFRDGRVELRFKLENPNDNLGLNFADLEYKPVHAGHICMAKIGLKDVQLRDLKTGVMDLKTREMRLAKTITEEQEAILKTKEKKFPNKLDAGKWHHLTVEILGDTMSLAIDQKPIASFSSEGIAHPTKRTLRIAVPQQVVIDDLKVYALQR